MYVTMLHLLAKYGFTIKHGLKSGLCFNPNESVPTVKGLVGWTCLQGPCPPITDNKWQIMSMSYCMSTSYEHFVSYILASRKHSGKSRGSKCKKYILHVNSKVYLEQK